MTTTRVRSVRALVAVVGLAAGCSERPRAIWEETGAGAPREQVDSATAAGYATLEPGVLGTVEALPVKGWKGPGGKPFEVARRSAAPEAGHSREFGTVTLPIALRSRAAGLSQYPCTSCHAGRKLLLVNKRIADAHNNIRPVHPAQTGSVCATCHSGENVELLALRGGERAELDESYRLCGQCHFPEADAWAGGAHGKRLDGWEGRRVVMACTDCHDPHNPELQPRIPFRPPQLGRARSTTHE